MARSPRKDDTKIGTWKLTLTAPGTVWSPWTHRHQREALQMVCPNFRFTLAAKYSCTLSRTIPQLSEKVSTHLKHVTKRTLSAFRNSIMIKARYRCSCEEQPVVQVERFPLFYSSDSWNLLPITLWLTQSKAVDSARALLEKLLTYLSNLLVDLVEIRGAENVQSLNYALALEGGPSIWSGDKNRPQSCRSIIRIQSSINTLHITNPWRMVKYLATVLNYNPGVPELAKPPNPFSGFLDLLNGIFLPNGIPGRQ